eukprot:359907-Chlamydomonas_euryale.AAC.1
MVGVLRDLGEGWWGSLLLLVNALCIGLLRPMPALSFSSADPAAFPSFACFALRSRAMLCPLPVILPCTHH